MFPLRFASLAMDVHKNTISAGLLEPDSTLRVVDKISTDDESVRRLIARFEEPTRVWACYEAGPTGYELARVLRAAGMGCEVIAPSLIPTRQGDRVKTDRRDARRLALLFRAGQLSPVRVPTVAEEAVRDLCRARADMVIDRTRAPASARQVLAATRPGVAGWRQLDAQARDVGPPAAVRRAGPEGDDVQSQSHYQATLSAREAAVDAPSRPTWRRGATGRAVADAVHRMAAYRGITELGGLTLASEVCDWRRFPTAGLFMGFTGLVPSESSSGERTSRGGITHAGNAHLRTKLVEAAWAYKSKPQVGAVLKRRQEGLDPAVVARAWAAQLRPCGKSAASTPARPTARSSSSLWPASSPGSCAPRRPPELR